MRGFILLLFLICFVFTWWAAEASPAGVIVKHLKNFSPVLKWTRASPKAAETDGDAPQFENGYFVETLVDGNRLGIEPYTIRVSPEGELFAVDTVNNNIVKITPPLSQYSRARLVAGSFQGYSGHVDGKPSDARFSHPKGVAMDQIGNVYVADAANLAIRKIGESGVATIAGGKSNVAGYRDGPSEDAMFSSDFDIVYVPRMCSLLVVDRGNAALRQISLQQEDCDHQYNSISTSDIAMVVGAILAGYVSCFLQHGLESSLFSKKQVFVPKLQNHSSVNKPAPVVESLKEESDAGWPSPGRLFSDLAKFAIEAIGSALFKIILIPRSLLHGRKGLIVLKDNLVMPEEKAEPPLVQKQVNSSGTTESVSSSNINTDIPTRHQKSSKPPKFKDSALLSKHRSTKRQDYADFYSTEASQAGSKSHKDRMRHRRHEKNGEVVYGAVGGAEPKSVETMPKEYNESKFDHYNMNSKYGTDNTYRY